MNIKEKLLATVGFSVHRDSVATEITAGITTFMTMAYILSFTSVMFAPLAYKGFPISALFTSTALGAIVGTLLMAFLAKRPFGLAPGLTLNIFFVQTICVTLGYSWQFALTAVLIEGIIFSIISLTSLRQLIMDMMPPSIKYGIAVGIGLFVAQIGFKNSGLLDEGTVFNHLNTLTESNSILFVIGLVLTGIFTILRIRGGLLISIAITTIIGIPMGVTHLPDHLFSMPSSPAPLMFQFEWDMFFTSDLWVCIITMLFFDIFDTLGTVVGLMANAGLVRKNGRIPHMRNIMLSDALATSAGACLGCSTVTTYVESTTGVAEGGRTGLTALVIAICFLLSLFLAPLFLAIPAAATAPVMVMAGFYLFDSVRHIDVRNPIEAMPAFLTMLLMPVTGSISDGIVAGLFTFTILSLVDGWIHRKNNRYDDDEDFNDEDDDEDFNDEE